MLTVLPRGLTNGNVYPDQLPGAMWPIATGSPFPLSVLECLVIGLMVVGLQLPDLEASWSTT